MDELLAQLHPFFMVLSFVLGALVGSFCNVCISRWPQDLSVVSPRSRCPRCHSGIAWYDNIPVLSWLILGAKCRNCGLPISWQYPVVEALTGVLFFLVYLRFGVTVATPIYMYLCAAMVIVTFVDLSDWIIPNEITFTGIPFGIALSLVGLFYPESNLRVVHPFDALLGVALGGGILYLLDQITILILKKPGMGFGDVKLLAMLGAFLGWQGVLGTLMLACFIGSFVGVGMIVMAKSRGAKTQQAKLANLGEGGEEDTVVEVEEKAGPTDEDEQTLEGHYIPFGPYLAVAGLLFLFFGPEAIAAYLASLQPAPLMPLSM
jgi:leader peptidase (prepilin peptidase)/N-methyltransferase